MSTAPQPEPVLHRAAPAWEEVRVGKADAATVLLVYAHIEEVARFDHYPPPAGHPEWGPEAIQEVASSFYAKTKPEKRFAKLKAGVNDAVSFDKKLKTAVRNHMRSEARESETGRVIRLLEHAIGNDPDVVAQDKGSAKTWSLPEHADLMPFAGSPAALVDAAYAVEDVRPAKWALDSPNRPPLAEPDSLRRVIHAVLDAAGAPLQRADLAYVMQDRFPTAIEQSHLEIEPEQAVAADDPAIAGVVDDIWRRLNADQKLIVGLLDAGPAEIERRTGVPSSTAHRITPGTQVLLQECLADCDPDEYPAISRELIARSAAVKRRGKKRAGLASGSVEDTQ